MIVDDVVIEQIAPSHPKARRLLDAAEAEAAALYPPESRHDISPEDAAAGVMLVAWLDGDVVASAVLMPMTAEIGELKRLFVLPEYRKLGLARAMMASIENLAAELRIGLIRLETGTRSPAAGALYEALGYQRVPCFGIYADDPLSICYEKRLPAKEGLNAP